MDRYIKKYIEDHIDLIDENDFNSLYNSCPENLRGLLSESLYNCGIDPLSYLTSVPRRMWFESESLEQFKIPAGIKSIEASAFEDSTIEEVFIPASVVTIHTAAFCGCKQLKTITFESGSSLKLIGSSCFENCSSIESIDLPEHLILIFNDSFTNCSSLKSIKIPESVNKIGDYAFSHTDLSTVTLPSNIADIGKAIFFGCSSLKDIYIDQEKPGPGWRPINSGTNANLHWRK